MNKTLYQNSLDQTNLHDVNLKYQYDTDILQQNEKKEGTYVETVV